MKKSVREVQEAVGAMGRSAPIVKVGETLAKGGQMAQDAYDWTEKWVRGKTTPKRPTSRDVHLPRQPKRPLARKR